MQSIVKPEALDRDRRRNWSTGKSKSRLKKKKMMRQGPLEKRKAEIKRTAQSDEMTAAWEAERGKLRLRHGL